MHETEQKYHRSAFSLAISELPGSTLFFFSRELDRRLLLSTFQDYPDLDCFFFLSMGSSGTIAPPFDACSCVCLLGYSWAHFSPKAPQRLSSQLKWLMAQSTQSSQQHSSSWKNPSSTEIWSSCILATKYLSFSMNCRFSTAMQDTPNLLTSPRSAVEGIYRSLLCVSAMMIHSMHWFRTELQRWAARGSGGCMKCWSNLEGEAATSMSISGFSRSMNWLRLVLCWTARIACFIMKLTIKN